VAVDYANPAYSKMKKFGRPANEPACSKINGSFALPGDMATATSPVNWIISSPDKIILPADTELLPADMNTLFADTNALLTDKNTLFADTSLLLTGMKVLFPDMTPLLPDKMAVSGSKTILSADKALVPVGKKIQSLGKKCLSADQTARRIGKIKDFSVGIPDASQISMNTTTSLRVSHRYTRLSDGSFSMFASSVIIAMTNNPAFPNPLVPLAELSSLQADFADKLATSLGGGKIATAAKNNARAALTDALRREGGYLSMNTETPPLSNGFQRLYCDAAVFEAFSAPHMPVRSLLARGGFSFNLRA
jgi:hypothetical protein